MGAYQYPTRYRKVSAGGSFQNHKDRRPPSPNPGSDYPCPMGTPVYAVHPGVVVGIVDPSDPRDMGGGGRMVYVDHDDGTGVDFLHLSKINDGAGIGNAKPIKIRGRVGYDTLVGLSGASGTGSDTFYDPHLHVSWRMTHGHHATNYKNRDFDAMMKAGTAGDGDIIPIPIKQGDDGMLFVRRGDGNWALYDGLVWTDLSQTQMERVKVALGRGAGELSSAAFDALRNQFPNKSLGGGGDIEVTVPPISAADVQAIADATDAKIAPRFTGLATGAALDAVKAVVVKIDGTLTRIFK